ncbi:MULTISPECIES: HipA domain-containing protein [unclassified Acinetobacter]|uniref:type II toxin-antitoxin system HipA family toxin n=1 Tax=unclassified Acinetobacter TaxID=196816 RepID=UPI00244AFABA|nr:MULTISPECIES: HipA domain-containing protein [unclassified Acinetobacter]MDH0030866.1 HipA domain-containing protein [Acinetobacter sp. GD04021]MDH0886361.1 HipA domain-containing protein [Acinetobacter sp. GD03873]MDH1082889.1 HipA domain-containing protein [Acinetobacter sp. GD03983]MDH2189915.1 HipA domain-containing protein [Acinetobacter sp. GD03645]MDH2203068.1 HipA domain-containing protein [Acinetobacter sp. GD03647]
MNKKCTIQIFEQQQWRDCAVVELLGDPKQGWEASTRIDYLLDYALDYLDQCDANAISWNIPVSLNGYRCSTWAACLMDLLPQGYGRQELLKQLGLSETAQQHADWALLCAGAGNPIGHLRIKEAAEWLVQKDKQPPVGFHLHDIMQRKEHFYESLANYGVFVAGSSGVQGEWPKLLLTQGHDDLFYLDHTLPDALAKKHWLVKFSRGENPRLQQILNHEAKYMQLAQFLGLRVHELPQQHGQSLFIPRFDRTVENGQVQRYAQESIASLNEVAGFGVRVSHNRVCELLSKVCTDPKTEILEYLQRDIANVALGNKDNHSRNTAIQRHWDGRIHLTPLFDFAPMWLHPDGIARTTRWEQDDIGGSPDWNSVLQQIHMVTGIEPSELKMELVKILPKYQQLIKYMQQLNIDDEIIDKSRLSISAICQQLGGMLNG